ncbi:MAG: YihY/virulence factor BrkB family protein [Pseudomonadota bacterium]
MAHPGEMAARPGDIPARGWKQVATRAWKDVGDNQIGLIAAGVAFYGLLALFPAITAVMAISGLVFDASHVTTQLDEVSQVLPADAAAIIIDQATKVAGSQDAGLGVALIFSLGLALYSASKGVGSLIQGVNVAYGEQETRGFVMLTATNLALTVFLILGMIGGLGATLILPGILSLVDLGLTTEILIRATRWAVLLAFTVGGIMMLYRIAPDRRAAQWRWLLPGAVLACALWLLASLGFAIYVENFGAYTESFGALAGVIVLLTWMWLSAYVILIGAEINSEAEAQVRPDTTIGEPALRGERDAVKADELVGEQPV